MDSMDWCVHLDAPSQWHGQQPVSGTADHGVVKQDKSSGDSVDTTKTRSDPQTARMCKGERSIGAAKGKETNTMASCQPPPPPTTNTSTEHTIGRPQRLRAEGVLDYSSRGW